MLRLETKNGVEYYADSYLKTLQEIFFDSLLSLDQLCKENGIQYFLDGGTAIGAIRDGDIVFWDDDIDISMEKSDYLRIVDIINRNTDKYFLQDSTLTKHCCGYFCSRERYFITYGKYRRDLSPIKIDIRPINLIPDTDEEKKNNRVFRELSNLLLFNKCSDQYRKEALYVLSERFDNSKYRFFDFYNHEYGLYEKREEALYVHPYMEYSNDKFYRYTDYYPLVEKNFHGHDFYVPQCNYFMKDYYGDFMQYPPIDTRKPESTGLYSTNNPEFYYNGFKEISDGLFRNNPVKKINWIMHIIFDLHRIK